MDDVTGAILPEAGPTLSAQQYTKTAALLHWIIAALILANLVLGFMCGWLELAFEDTIMNLHKVIGLLVLALSFLRLAWRLSHRPPEPVNTAALQRRAAGAVHFALYALMLVLPFSGWLVTSSFPKRHPISVGLFDLPFLPVGPSLARAMFAHGVHEALSLVMLGLVMGHIMAALYHQLVLRDGLIARMRLGNDG